MENLLELASVGGYRITALLQVSNLLTGVRLPLPAPFFALRYRSELRMAGHKPVKFLDFDLRWRRMVLRSFSACASKL